MAYGLEDSQVDFELFYPLLSQRGFKEYTYYRIVQRLIYSEPEGIEDALFKLLNHLPFSAKRRIIDFLVEQKYQPLFAYLLEMKNVNSHTLEDFSFVCETLAKLDSIESTKAAIDCMKLSFVDEQMIQQILYVFNNLSTDIPLDFETLRKVVMPHFDNQYIKQSYYDLVGKFQVKREIPFLLENLSSDFNDDDNLSLFYRLLEFDISEVSEPIRQMVEKAYQAGKIKKGIYDYLINRLNDKLNLKEWQIAKRHPSRFTPTPAFVKEQRRINKISKTASSLRNTDPKLYIQVETKYLTELAKLIEKYPLSQSKYFPELSKGYVGLADFMRFYQKKPEQAIIFYEESLKFPKKSPRHEQLDLESLMGIADIYQYALNQPQKAIEYYSRLLEQLKPMKLSREEEWAIFLWLKNWLTHEINYLQTGQPFRGEIGNNRIGQFMVILYFLPVMIVNGSFLKLGPEVSLRLFDWRNPKITQKGRQSVTDKLMTFEPSHFTLLKTYLMVPLLATPEDILKYLAKHDPAGYWTAHLLGMVLFVEGRKKAQSGNKREQHDLHFKFFPGLTKHSALDQPLGKAAQQYFNDHNLQIADSRFSTPQKTMQLYLQGLRNKDVETVSLCFSQSRQTFQRRSVDRASPATLKEIADSYTDVFTIIKQTEHSATASTERRFKNGKIQTVFFDFKNEQGEWKIDMYRYPKK
jgi:tetratricopeptide (TPR) repeat protein